MPYRLRIFTAEDVDALARVAAESRFRQALNESLGDEALVLPVYRAYRRLLEIHGDKARPWSLSPPEQMLADQWEAAELAATHAAFGVDRYLGDADFEIS